MAQLATNLLAVWVGLDDRFKRDADGVQLRAGFGDVVRRGCGEKFQFLMRHSHKSFS